jgi:uncharacterized protein YraI
MKKLPVLLISLVLLAAACGTSKPPVSTETVTAPYQTSTLTPTYTLLPPQPTTTPIPIEGTVTSKVNVRSGPDTTFDSLGMLNTGDKIQIISQNGKKTWIQIVYPSAPQGTGWVAAFYVKLADGVRIPTDATPTPLGPTGLTTQKVNVRGGPATTFDSLGMLDADTTVLLTGKNSTASWYQIEYTSGPGGHGWVTAQYIKTDVTDLPVLDDYGTPAATDAPGTASAPGSAPTPTVGIAPDDLDSLAAPSVRITFSATGARQFVYSSLLSAPQGDGEDWIEFTPFTSHGTTARLTVTLACTGNGTLVVDLLQNGAPVTGWGSIQCGDTDKQISIPVGGAYIFHLVPAAGDGLRMISYTLTVRNEP